MSRRDGTHLFDTMVADADSWLGDIERELGDPNPRHAYQALRGTLFALRDRLPVAEGAHLSAQLPTLVRGVYYDGFRLDRRDTPTNRREFLERIRRDAPVPDGTDPEQALRAVLRVMDRRLDPHELAKVRDRMPRDIRRIWQGERP